MNQQVISLFLVALTIASLGMTLIYVVGIVWRVEKELDLSYKFLLLAVFFFLASEILDVWPVARQETWQPIFIRGIHLAAAISLFVSMFRMRDIVRCLNGEKSKE